MRKISIVSIAAVFMFILAGNAFSGEKEKTETKAAVVNGTVITQQQLESQLVQAKMQAASRGQQIPPDKADQLKSDMLDNLINAELLYQASQKKGIKIDDKQVEEEFAKFRGRFQDDAMFQNAIAMLNMTEANVRTEMHRGMAVKELLDKEIMQKIVISDEDTKSFYNNNPDFFKTPEQVKASHILIKIDADADEKTKTEAKKKLEKLRKQIKKGADFAELAKENSGCPSSAKGGDLGFFSRRQMLKPFSDAAFALKKGEISDIVETKYGYHIIKLTDRKPEGTTSYEDAKDGIGKVLKQQKIQQEIEQYIGKLREDAKIEKMI